MTLALSVREAVQAVARQNASLTPRQLEVLRLAGQGLRDAEIAERLSLSLATVRHHQEEARLRLRASTCAHAVALAYRRGLL